MVIEVWHVMGTCIQLSEKYQTAQAEYKKAADKQTVIDNYEFCELSEK